MQPFTIQRFYYAPVIVKMMMESSHKTTFLSHKGGLYFSLRASSNLTEEGIIGHGNQQSCVCSSPFKVHQSQQRMKRNHLDLRHVEGPHLPAEAAQESDEASEGKPNLTILLG